MIQVQFQGSKRFDEEFSFFLSFLEKIKTFPFLDQTCKIKSSSISLIQETISNAGQQKIMMYFSIFKYSAASLTIEAETQERTARLNVLSIEMICKLPETSSSITDDFGTTQFVLKLKRIVNQTESSIISSGFQFDVCSCRQQNFFSMVPAKLYGGPMFHCAAQQFIVPAQAVKNTEKKC